MKIIKRKYKKNKSNNILLKSVKIMRMIMKKINNI